MCDPELKQACAESFTYLFPARGRKHEWDKVTELVHKQFHLPIPRKGTETFETIEPQLLFAQFHLPIPRKGTETCKSTEEFKLFTSCFTYLFPARGRKHIRAAI